MFFIFGLEALLWLAVFCVWVLCLVVSPGWTILVTAVVIYAMSWVWNWGKDYTKGMDDE